MFDTSGRIASIKGAALNMAAAGASEGTVNLSQENEDLKVGLLPKSQWLYTLSQFSWWRQTDKSSWCENGMDTISYIKRTTLNFRKFKVAPNPFPRMFLTLQNVVSKDAD